MDKSIFNFKIQKLDGTIIDLHEKNLFVNSCRIISPSPSHITEKTDGRHGSIYIGTELNDRKITAQITVEATDYIDFDLFRDEIFSIFNPLEKFYIIRDIQPNKRHLVSVASEFDIEYIWLDIGEFKMEFVNHSVFPESIGTTLDPFTFDSEKWGIGVGLDSETLKYVHTTDTFRIYNAGNITLDPRVMPLLITFKGASKNLSIKNTTTNDEWKLTGSTVALDIVTLSGIRSLKNSTSIFGNTNKKLITLKPGWNDFKITGATDFSISFDFRFYYL